MNSISIVLFSAAITLVFTRGSLFDVFRLRGPGWSRELAQCPLCSGVWIGCGLGLWASYVGHLSLPAPLIGSAPYLLGIGCSAGVVALTVNRVWMALEALAER